LQNPFEMMISKFLAKLRFFWQDLQGIVRIVYVKMHANFHIFFSSFGLILDFSWRGSCCFLWKLAKLAGFWWRCSLWYCEPLYKKSLFFKVIWLDFDIFLPTLQAKKCKKRLSRFWKLTKLVLARRYSNLSSFTSDCFCIFLA
jgi:hypothetical protein